MQAKSKTDKNSAFLLADLLRIGAMEGICVHSNEIQELIDLTRHREPLVRKKGGPEAGDRGCLGPARDQDPSGVKTNFTQKFIDHIQPLDDFIFNEKLDLLLLTIEKLKNVEKLIEDQRFG
jgi:hypothetical protein